MKKSALVVREAASAYAHLGVTTGQLLSELVGEDDETVARLAALGRSA